MLKLGVFGKSRKDDEKRLPIHPEHLKEIDPTIRSHMYFERDYGAAFGVTDSELERWCGGILKRTDLLNTCDIALMAKPTLEDFKELPEGKIHWGWPHCVQQEQITQESIDKKLTLIAWEAMHEWDQQGGWLRHTFYKNNEIAGYAGVHHAFNLLGIDGNFGPSRSAAVLGYGSVSQGAIQGLRSRGVQQIEVFVPYHYIPGNIGASNLKYYKFLNRNQETVIQQDRSFLPIIDFLSEADIIINGILQDTDDPYMFVRDQDIAKLRTQCLIIDISCDEGMGFEFARPTSFRQPFLDMDDLNYYAVDHTPSYLWNAASWEISRSLLPYLPTVMTGPQAWSQNRTIQHAIEIETGHIKNPKILTFQNRAAQFPHDIIP